ncbi:MAG: electron transfer flavoprotein [Cyanobacteria bacterium J055]|nr:MAG: electron transfer flavoprotein [Cyanobacteria bacterium J055]
MNRQRSLLIAIGFLTFLAIGCTAEVSQTEPAATPEAIASTPPVTPSAAPTTAQTSESSGSPLVVVPNSGHSQISGTARTIAEGEKRYLVLDKTFETESGPDLTVVLVRSPELTSPQLEEGSYFLLGELQANSGEQRYEIPSNVNLEDFGSVAIWCRQFNTTFGYANLSKS